ncbi:MAG: O-antigen ligase family protein [Ignavibacteria bacterium]|nr:O-antigen ligase family protein [Ignavibacteria bacterium]
MMPTGYFMHPNTASHFYTIMIPIIFYKYFTKKFGFTEFIIILFLFILALLFTFSRAGYIGASVSLLIVAYSRSKKYFFITIILFAASVYFFLIDFISAKGDSSIARLLLWVAAVNMIVADLNHSLWGYGVTNALTVFQNEKIYFGSIEEVPDPHNIILLLSIQFGLLFVISLLIFLITLFIKIFSARNTNYFSENKFKIYLCISILLGLISQNMLENVLAYPEHFVLNVFFIFSGMLYYFVNNYEKKLTQKVLMNG